MHPNIHTKSSSRNENKNTNTNYNTNTNTNTHGHIDQHGAIKTHIFSSRLMSFFFKSYFPQICHFDLFSPDKKHPSTGLY